MIIYLFSLCISLYRYIYILQADLSRVLLGNSVGLKFSHFAPIENNFFVHLKVKILNEENQRTR